MAETSRAHGDPPQPDENETPERHDQEGRAAGPYAPPGRDEQGNPIPSVPHEGLLGRIGASLIAGEAVVLAVVGVAGLVVSWGSGFFEQSPTTVLALRLNPAHSVLLLLTAVLAAVCAPKRTRLRRFAAGQGIVYVILFLAGTALSMNTGDATVLDLNTPDIVLHAVLALLGFIVLIITSARTIEPPPGPLPYPGAVPSAGTDDGPSPDAPTPPTPEPGRASGDSRHG